MTGKIRHSIGLLVAAVLAALVGFLLTLVDVPQARDIGAFVILAGVVLAVVGLARIVADLTRSPQRD